MRGPQDAYEGEAQVLCRVAPARMLHWAGAASRMQLSKRMRGGEVLHCPLLGAAAVRVSLRELEAQLQVWDRLLQVFSHSRQHVAFQVAQAGLASQQDLHVSSGQAQVGAG